MGPKFHNFFSTILLVMLCVFMATGCQTTRKFSSDEIAFLKQAGFTEVDDENGISLEGRILFSYMKYDLTDESREVIARIVLALKQLKVENVRVEGHADNTGTDPYNAVLSLRRAEAVANEMVVLGMKPENIVSRGMGRSLPVAENRTQEGRAQNRRAVIIVPAY